MKKIVAVQKVGIGVSLLSVAFVVLSFVLFWSRLPEPMATHWDFSGTANDHLSRSTTLFVHLAFAVMAGAVAAFSRNRAMLGLGIFSNAFSVVLALVVVRANLDQQDWQSADIASNLLWLGFFLVVLICVGATVSAVAFGRVNDEAEDAARKPTLTLGDGGHAAWFQTMRVRGWSWLAFAAGVVGMLSVVGGSKTNAAAFVFIAAVCAMFAVVRVRVGVDGVAIAYGPFGLVRQRILRDKIVFATTQTVQDLRYGGWGYRMYGPWLRNTAVVLRSGECLSLSLRGDRSFLITVDNAEEAAAVLNSTKGGSIGHAAIV